MSSTPESTGAIRRKPVESLKVEREERSKATPPFDFAQGRESVERPFGFAQGHEPVEWQMMP